ncbi:MAG: hypothetical protein ACOCR0_02065 [Haloferacaceae archaeon]
MSLADHPDRVVVETPRGNYREGEIVDRDFEGQPQRCIPVYTVAVDGVRFVVHADETRS